MKVSLEGEIMSVLRQEKKEQRTKRRRGRAERRKLFIIDAKYYANHSGFIIIDYNILHKFG